ncbi:UDP-N-acetylmuramoyl-tripeptide--D-alanyl-D-alanine ligase [Alkaliphilus hydrothermalis]|uniref:UDP-N-acetylmuramoyl-tripeptide--D-alanyl-D-alanine ligase n=1 Tax=Alkaliphilus hydrothermalis TaxID=1482730 RepID=A0ABS2NNT7_9FIRM|nr:UDP-N-acetylmuramoyl-tripeptide--D-alanyl-D-alanine ligase [Alkaliphilus hydrothermalis]MBM7614591.1 UDP-N-acetylmuramoyl-tripeptide--D-alanyl-D-alanine ligase [Alkaliphilus hydrothermalis]
MKQLSIDWVTSACGGKLIQQGSRNEIFTISTDSRTNQEGALFIPLVGENFDGHRFISQAIEKGAIAVLKAKDFELDFRLESVNIIEVEDTLVALKEISRHYRQLFNIPFVGVTGSTGKTTTKDLISSVLAAKFNVLKNVGNFNNQIGLPMTLFNLEAEHQMGILEMGMSSFGEIESLVELVRPNIAVITNIGMSHIENLGSKEGILKAKMEIATYLKKEDYLLLNGDDEYLKNLRGQESSYDKIFFGISKENDFYPNAVEDLGEAGFKIVLTIKEEAKTFSIKYPGLHNVYNGLVAIWIGLHNGMTPDEIQKGLDGYIPTKMRLEIVNLPKLKVINDAYNASPDSMKAAITVLKSIEGKRKIAILGNILEMGSFAEEGHRIVGEFVAQTGIDILITVGTAAKWIAEEAKDIGIGIKEIYSVENNNGAIELLEGVMEEKDVILVKGSRGMKMEEIINYIQERS